MDSVTVVSMKDDKRELVLDGVTRVIAGTHTVTLYKPSAAPITLAASVGELDLQEGELVLVPVPSSPVEDWITRRRSVRKYTKDPVSEADVQLLLRVAMAAPSGRDIRPWHFVVVRDAKLRQELGQVHTWSYMCADAPVVIAVCGEPAASHHWIADCSAATENILLAASGIGLGAVWVAVFPVPEREEKVRRILKLPEHIRPLCLIPIGHPAERKTARTRYEERKVHYDVVSET